MLDLLQCTFAPKQELSCRCGDDPYDQSQQVHTSHFFYGLCTSQRPKICICDPGELLLDGVQEVLGYMEASVGRVLLFWVEPAQRA